jgi:hypothetical protein
MNVLKIISEKRVVGDIRILIQKYIQSLKGQIISKRFFLAKDSSKKQTKTRRILVKTNSFVGFLEESSA